MQTKQSSAEVFKIVAVVAFWLFIIYLFVGGSGESSSVRVDCTTDGCHDYYSQKVYEQGQDNSRPDYLDAQGL